MPEFTKKVARAHSRKRLRTIRDHLERIAHHWGDLDGAVCREIDYAFDAIGTLDESMDDALRAEEESRG